MSNTHTHRERERERERETESFTTHYCSTLYFLSLPNKNLYKIFKPIKKNYHRVLRLWFSSSILFSCRRRYYSLNDLHTHAVSKSSHHSTFHAFAKCCNSSFEMEIHFFQRDSMIFPCVVLSASSALVSPTVYAEHLLAAGRWLGRGKCVTNGACTISSGQV